MEAGVAALRVRDPAGVALAAVLVGMLTLLAVADGGFNTDVFLPVALFSVGLLLILALARPDLLSGLPGPAKLALLAFTGFVVWSFASITWADVKGEAWTGANRALLYLVVFAVFSVWPWTPLAGSVALGGFALAVTVVGVASIELARRADDPLDAFVGPLFVEPIGYHNGTAALFALAFWPALLLASRREVHPLVRGASLAAAGVLLSLAVVSQSRGWLLVFPIALTIYLALVPGRARSILALAPVLGTTLLALDPLLDLYTSAEEDAAAEGLARVRDALAWQGATLFVLGTAAAFVDRRVSVPAVAARRGAQVIVAATIVAAAIGIGVALPEDPLGRAEAAWQEFKSGDRSDDGTTHFTSGLGSNRYDFWRVGFDMFADAPLHGNGADNFAADYLLDRRSDEEPLYPHSLEVQMLSQVGIVGSSLLGLFFAAAVLGALGRRGELGAAVSAAAVATSVYWVGHASGDWLWEIPAVTAPALGFLGLALGLARPALPPSRPPAWVMGVGAAAAIAAAVSLTLPWLAAKEMRAAASGWAADPDVAYERLARARALDFLSDRPDQLLGAIASRREDWQTMRSAFERALERNPSSWYAHFELALVAAVEGRRDESLRRLALAERLNPSEPLIAELRIKVVRGQPVDPDQIDRVFLERLESRTG